VLLPGYRVIALLSRGNRLDVFDAWSEERDSRCVLKTLRPDRATDRSARRALEAEGRLLRRLTHPHLVRAYETLRSADGRPVVVLETLSGETLSHLVHRLRDAGSVLDPPDVAMLGRQLCSAVGYLHRHGLLHRDVKPANIVADGGRVRLIDLSLVRRPGWALGGAGTLDYMAPEQVRDGTLGPAVDAWGIGAVLHTALTGWPPFGYGTPPVGSASGSGTASAERAEDWPQLSGRAPRLATRRDLPDELAVLVDACLEPDPGARPSVQGLAAGLDAWLAAVGQPA
jgi:serine/threonine protein kinase